MSHTKSAKKRLRQNVKLRARNKSNRGTLKKQLKQFEQAAQAQPADAGKAYAEVQRALDVAARKNAIPKKRADRKKSRLAKMLQRLKAPAAPAAAPKA